MMCEKSCCVCKCESTKYKCPKCKQPYCSVTCCTKHKEGCVEISEYKSDEIIETSKSTTNYDFPTEDTVPLEKLEQLRFNDEVKNCLKNPQVRDIIKGVLSSKDPTESIAKAMAEPIFVELADACLKIVEPSNDEVCDNMKMQI